MPIHINLLAEAQAQEEMRRHDPVKRAIFVGVSLVAIALMWGFVEFVNAHLASEQWVGVQQAIDAKTNAYSHALADLKKVTNVDAQLKALDQLQAARFLQGSLMDALQHATVNGVALRRVLVEQSYFAAKPRQIHGRPAGPAGVTEHVTVTLIARDSSENPGDQINPFLKALAAEPYFASRLASPRGIELTGPPSALMIDAARPYVMFSVICNFPDQTR
ncbi:MAG: hypothetical protein KGR98_13390 [Verrucomicrobia bacterium]|nr:hypothetical protein [Verrucomicrobiota bacterium]MDE3098570.1 hypothetical protein [Verrucomicrobiota bacterium]